MEQEGRLVNEHMRRRRMLNDRAQRRAATAAAAAGVTAETKTDQKPGCSQAVPSSSTEVIIQHTIRLVPCQTCEETS